MLNPKDASIISDMVSSVGNLIQASAWSRIKTAPVEAQKQSASPTNTTKATICPMCKGYGELSKPPYDDSDVCPACNGTGKQ